MHSDDAVIRARWLVSQIGGREHYAIARSLHQRGQLSSLVTDFWCRPGSRTSRWKSLAKLHDRWHDELSDANVVSPYWSLFCEEALSRAKRLSGWDRILHRNHWFQSFAKRHLKASGEDPKVLFSYSYASRELLPVARQRGMHTVVGQIDPGPEEERIVGAEHERYAHLKSAWRPAPAEYWDSWRSEMEQCDRIMVNSKWSAECLGAEAIDKKKIDVVPLVYRKSQVTRKPQRTEVDRKRATWKVLFLGQINLRKGVGRLLDAMRLLADDGRFQLILAGPTEIDPVAWSDLPNVRWTGPLRRSEVDQVYQQADVFILPTLSDGFALTQLEALSNGLPIIASRHCGEVVCHGSNGLVLGDLEPETIAKAMVASRDMDFQAERVNTEQGPSFGLDDLGDRLNQITDRLDRPESTLRSDHA